MSDIIFHYNKHHNIDPSVPPWLVKYKGETIYINHLISEIGFSTKEPPDNPHTKGSIKFKGTLEIKEEDGKIIAYIK